MSGVLFVSNGHGEDSIAAAIAHQLRALRFANTDHFPLVGDAPNLPDFAAIGPRRGLPSGGLVAMFNLRNIIADLRGGLLALTLAQMRFLRRVRRTHAYAVAVGDVYCLALTLLAGLPTIFVGTAKSITVAGYGPFERAVLRRARHVFVRDEATASWLRARGVAAHAPGNVIVDLLDSEGTPPDLGPCAIVLLPGSRVAAYDDVVALAAIVRAIAQVMPQTRAIIAIAGTLDPAEFATRLRAAGWRVEAKSDPLAFEAFADDRPLVVGWTGPLGAALRAATLAIGQAGTANEAAAALGLPVVAVESAHLAGSGWYRERQRGLLGDALLVVRDEGARAADAIVALLRDEERLAHMRSTGPKRLGGPGGARAIARTIHDDLAAVSA